MECRAKGRDFQADDSMLVTAQANIKAHLDAYSDSKFVDAYTQRTEEYGAEAPPDYINPSRQRSFPNTISVDAVLPSGPPEYESMKLSLIHI